MGRRVVWSAGAILAATTIAFAGSASAERAHVGYPSSMVVLGHSGATGFNSDPQRPYADAPENSWATGSNPEVRSLYLRLLDSNPAIRGHNANLAQNGAKIFELTRQASRAVRLRPKPQLVVIQILDNDIRCDGTDSSNYAPFRKSFVGALTTLSRGLPNARIYVVSTWGRPATYAEAIKNIPEARNLASGNGPCDLFDSAGNLVPEHVAYLTSLVENYETQLRNGCARFLHCRWDGGALGRLVDDAAYLSSDWAHASIAGHKAIAAQAWTGMFDFADTAAPVSQASVSRGRRSRIVALSATDTVGVAGVEYKVVPRKGRQSAIAFRRYGAPVRVKPGQSLVWRAVDVNGNTEATHSLRG